MRIHLPNHPLSRAINLAFNTGVAAAVPWLQVPRAIFGDLRSYISPPAGFETELSAFKPFTREALGSLVSVSCSLPFLGQFMRRPSGPVAYPGNYPDAHPRQRWFFINGVSADLRIAEKNARALSDMFGRPFTILYNATNGLLFDLYEAAVGKGFDTVTRAATNNFKPLVDALSDDGVDRVVVISHSQGTIIAAVLLKTLQELIGHPKAVRSGPGAQKESPERRVARTIASESEPHKHTVESRQAVAQARRLTVDHLRKLEFYCIANCCTSMSPIAAIGDPSFHVPWIESYGNEYDVVARLGVLAPPHGIGSARIEGERYRRPRMWGHQLNAHYLIPMIRELKQPDGHGLEPLGPNLYTRPRLWDYYAGQSPAPYPKELEERSR